MDRLTSMSVFTKVVEAGSFAAAAEAFDLSAPMVGKHVRFLEDRLGTRLLNRTTRRQSLTEFGRAYYERCKLVLAEARAADALADDLIGSPRGVLKVSMPVLFGRCCVAPILLRLAEAHPMLTLQLSFNDRLVDLLEDGFDLAIRNGRGEGGSGLMTRRLGAQFMVVCAAPAYLVERGAPERLEDLAAHRTILYSRSGRVRSWYFAGDAGAPIEIMPESRLMMDDLQVIADAALAGMGLAWLPCWLIKDALASGALVQVLPKKLRLAIDCHALWPQGPHLPSRTRVAIDALAAELPKVMG